MNIANRLIVGSITRTFLTVVNMVISFFLMPFLIRHLGDRWYGIWTVVGSLIGYYYLVDFGLASAVRRYIAKYIGNYEHEKANITINTALIIYSILGLILFLITIGLCFFIELFI